MSALMMTIHWSSGGETSVQTNEQTVREMMDLVRRGELAALTSEPGEPIWMLCIAPGGVSGMSVCAADGDAMICTPARVVLAATPALIAMRELLVSLPQVEAESVQMGLTLINTLLKATGAEGGDVG